MSSTLGDLLSDVADATQRKSGFLASYGMRRNPFPPARTIYPEIIYNQDRALRLFADGVKAVVGAELARRTLAILGGTGQGKSHFLRHCQYEVRRHGLPVVAVEFLAGTSSAVTLVRDIYRAADEHVKTGGEVDLLSAIISRLKDDDFGPVRQTDLRNALATLKQASLPGHVPAGMYGQYTADVLRDICWRWLLGESLSQSERRYLRVSGRLATASLMVRVMTELFALARQSGLFLGILVCLDEVEAVFFSGVSVRKIQAFLQDLRYLFDESVGQHSGYSLLVVAGSTPRGANVLRDYNYPLFQRLGFESEARVELHEVENSDEARHFADVYLEFEREQFNKETGSNISVERARSLVSDEDLKRAFWGGEGSPTADARNQARLLSELHRIIEEKQNKASPTQ
jgi:hypothetical protein